MTTLAVIAIIVVITMFAVGIHRLFTWLFGMMLLGAIGVCPRFPGK